MMNKQTDKTRRALKAVRWLARALGGAGTPRPAGFKALPGNLFLAWWTNNAVDHETEAFSSKALDDYVAAVDAGTYPQPELWFFHIPVRLGESLWTERVGHYVMSAGKFDEGVIPTAFYEAAQKDRFSMSHGFYYDPDQFQDGVYNAFQTFEISFLPVGFEANPYTSFEGVKAMPINDEKRKALEAILGAELAAQYLTMAETQSKALGAMPNVQFKSTATATDPDKPDASGVIAEIQAETQTLTAAQTAITDELKALRAALPDALKAVLEPMGQRLAALEKQINEDRQLAPRATRAAATQVNQDDPSVAMITKDKATQPPTILEALAAMMGEGRKETQEGAVK